MFRIAYLQKKINKLFFDKIKINYKNGCLFLNGELDSWKEVIQVCQLSVDKKKRWHVVNNIKCNEIKENKYEINYTDNQLDGLTPDILIIGAGVSGASISRELSKYNLNILVVDKENDVGLHASSRNDGEIHPGVDLNKGSLKQKYVLLGNKLFDELCCDLNIPFIRCGQIVGITKWILLIPVLFFVLQRRLIGVKDTKLIWKNEIIKKEPELTKKIKFGIYNSSAGIISPSSLVIALMENAIDNDVKLSLNTLVTHIDVQDNKIEKVYTNRGIIKPKIVINAAGVFVEDIAKMASDHFYSIHPRRGTIGILDKKLGHKFNSIASIIPKNKNEKNTKGGGVLKTVEGNLLIGPNAVETYDKELFITSKEEIDWLISNKKQTLPFIGKKDLITYFSGIRACTFEEDFVIEKGRNTKNLIHCAGIQSPGLTSAPAFAIDIANMAIELLATNIEKKKNFRSKRKSIPKLYEMPFNERQILINKNPDYGKIICRCEEISKGEVIDALESTIFVPTLDGIKRRVRPGMGRCQGSFCGPNVMKIISEKTGIPIEDIEKGKTGSYISVGRTKG